MRTEDRVQISRCPFDASYVVAKVTTSYIPNWWEKLWGQRPKTVSKEYRSKHGIMWYTVPEFKRVSYEFALWLELFYHEHKEREAYILATENPR